VAPVIYVVLSMHKSGSSLVAATLHAGGIDMGAGSDERSYDEGGTCERVATKEINHAILRAWGRPSIDIRAPRRLAIEAEVAARLATAARSLVRAGADCGFKDPRTCLVYPLWAAAIGEHRLVVIYRHWSELQRHYLPRSGGRLRGLVRAYKLVRSWCWHNRGILDALARSPGRAILLEYGAVMSGRAELARLERFVGRPLPDRRDPALYRGRRERGPGMRLAELLVTVRSGGRSPGRILRALERRRREQLARESRE
jgi:hypothetical protein